MEKIRFATVWLAGCSGCHMSFLDLDEWLIELSEKVEVVYSPVGCDLKEYPENVDVCLVEGGIANEDNLELIKQVRSRTKLLISFGDCAVTANVPAMRNMLGSTDHVLKRCYLELGDFTPQLPREPGIVPEDNLELIKQVRSRTKLLISFGDCAVTANVPAMRNMLGSTDHVLKRCYLELGDFTPQLPREPGIVPELLERVSPVHEVVDVDIFMPGCPPSSDRIKATLAPLVEGKMPKMEGREMIKFG